MDILDALRDLHQQATTHQVASTCKKAIAEIEKLRAALRVQNESALGRDIETKNFHYDAATRTLTTK